MPIRIQRKRTKGWKMPPNTVYVGRPTKWGNPFKGEDAVKYYKLTAEYLIARDLNSAGPAKLEGHEWDLRCFSRRGLKKLRGKNLACWCPLDKPCHADVLLKLANKGGSQ